MAGLGIERHGRVALLRFDNPPVNALTNPIRAALDRAIDDVIADPAVDAVVVAGANGRFVAGADIAELGQGVQPPFLADMLRRIEASPKPFIAAIRGHAMGGGLEIALACHARIAAPGTKFGVPELTLGLIPGAGATQRLPQLIGAAAALDLMLGMKRIEAAEALALGLIDAIEDDPEAAAAAKLPPARRAPHALEPDAIDAARMRVASDPALSALPAAQAAIDAVTAAFGNADAGFAKERALFAECLASDAARTRLADFLTRKSIGR